jgi:hypothetical protein
VSSQQAPAPAPAVQTAPAPRVAAPPVASSPPPTASRPVSSRPAPAAMPVEDVDVDMSVMDSNLFSPKFLAMMGGALVVGLLFGYLFSASSQARATYAAQKQGANQVRDIVVPKLVETKKAIDMVAAMDPNKPDFSTAAAAAELDFVPQGIFAGNGIRIGSDNIYAINQFRANASLFKMMLADHDKKTNKVDKEELEALSGGENADLLDKNSRFAVLFTHDVLLKHIAEEVPDAQYMPPKGSMVKITGLEIDEDGNVAYQSLNDNQERKISVRNLIPMNADQIIKTAGANTALTRYKARVNALKGTAVLLQNSMTNIEDNLNKLAERDDAPLIQVTASETPAEGKPAEGAPAEDAPAEGDEAKEEEAPAE